MRGTSNSRKDDLKEIIRLRKNLERRVKNIEKAGMRAYQFATRKYRDVLFPPKYSDLTDKQVRDLRRDLEYINHLKTSTVKGAVGAQKQWAPIEYQLRTFRNFSEDLTDKFWQAYSMAIEERPQLGNYKYIVFENILDDISRGYQPDEIIQNFEKAFKKATLEGYEDGTQEFAIRFTELYKEFQ